MSIFLFICSVMLVAISATLAGELDREQGGTKALRAIALTALATLALVFSELVK